LARTNTASNSNYLRVGAAVLTAYPLTITFWCKPAAAPGGGETYTLGGIFASGSQVDYWSIGLRSTSTPTNNVEFSVRDSGNEDVLVSSEDYVVGAWEFFGMVLTSATSRAGFHNLTKDTMGSTSITPSGLNRTSAFVLDVQFGPLRAMDGDIEHYTIWNAALTDNEMNALARGVHPLRIRPLSIQSGGYWPIRGDLSPEPDYSGNKNNLVLTGTLAAANGAPVEPYSRRFWGNGPLIEVAAAGRIMSSLARYGGLAGRGGIAGIGGGLAG